MCNLGYTFKIKIPELTYFRSSLQAGFPWKLNWLHPFTVVNFVGTSLQEIKIDCDIDDRASIAITKKGKVWEVSGIAVKRFQHACDVLGRFLYDIVYNYLDYAF